MTEIYKYSDNVPIIHSHISRYKQDFKFQMRGFLQIYEKK